MAFELIAYEEHANQIKKLVKREKKSGKEKKTITVDISHINTVSL